MGPATLCLEDIRRQLAALVDWEWRRTGSRMLAYQAVAVRFGRSEGWVRKVVGRAPDVTVKYETGKLIEAAFAAYQRLCLCIEAAAACEAARAGSIAADLSITNAGKNGLDAALAGDRVVVDGTAAAARAGAVARCAP